MAPLMPREQVKKATKVWMKVLGKPSNTSKTSKKWREIDERLRGQERRQLR